MSSVNGISGQRYVAPQTNKTQTAAKQSSARATADYYVPGDAQATQTETKAVPFTEDMATAMAENYDVRNMTRNEYTQLLAELRDNGVITSQEYSIAYGGTLPRNQAADWPHGGKTMDFSQLLRESEFLCRQHEIDSSKYMTEKEAAHAKSLTSTYSKLSGIFKQIGVHSPVPSALEDIPPSGEFSQLESTSAEKQYSDEVMRLYDQLRTDEKYMAKHAVAVLGVRTGDYPIRDQLLKELLLSDDALMEDFAKYAWTMYVKDNIETAERNARKPDKKPMQLRELPPDYTGMVEQFRYKLTHGGESGLRDINNTFIGFMRRKAITEPLTEIEQLVSPEGAAIHRTNWYTFDQCMDPVQTEIEKSFNEAGFSFDIDKEYQFYLDTATFTFSVTGGTEEENSLIEQAINQNPWETHLFNPLRTSVMALWLHRREDLSYNPWQWQVTSSEHAEMQIAKYGISNVNSEYVAKMQQFRAAFDLAMLDKNMKHKYGFGVDDISFQNGKWVGRTDEITAFIEKEDADWSFRKKAGIAYNSIMEDYTGTPTFEKPVFVFVNGEFKVTYEEWEY